MENSKKIIVFIIIGISIMSYIIYSIYNKKEYSYNEIEVQNVIKEQPNNEKANNIILHIAGAIKNEGIITLEEGDRVKDAIEAAGGTTEEANINNINLAYELSDGQKIYIPTTADEQEKEYIINGTGQDIIEGTTELELVNINTANQTELETITGIGPSTALKIVNYRKENGKFNSIEEIKNVSGIGDAKFESIKSQICVK